MPYLTGEYESFIQDGKTPDETVLLIGVECLDPDTCDKRLVEESIVNRFLKHKPGLAREYHDGNFRIAVRFSVPGGLELSRLKGRPKRLVDRRGTA